MHTNYITNKASSSFEANGTSTNGYNLNGTGTINFDLNGMYVVNDLGDTISSVIDVDNETGVDKMRL